MKTLKTFIEGVFQIPLVMILPKDDIELFPLDKDADKAYLFGSASAREHPYLIQADLDRFMQEAPEDYFLVGHWGYGSNSYSLMYQRVDRRTKTFFRLSYGGWFSDNTALAIAIRRFLMNWFVFEEKIRDKVKYIIAIESMGLGYYKVKPTHGRSIIIEKSLFSNPNFENYFKEILK